MFPTLAWVLAICDRFASRSAAVQQAIRLLHESALTDAYAHAYADWEDEDWESATGDGNVAK